MPLKQPGGEKSEKSQSTIGKCKSLSPPLLHPRGNIKQAMTKREKKTQSYFSVDLLLAGRPSALANMRHAEWNG